MAELPTFAPMFGMKSRSALSLLPALLLVGTISVCAWFSSCANIGSPNGGPTDEEPPILLKTEPEMNVTSYQGKKIEIYFDEYVVVENPSEKVIVSPPQLEPPTISTQATKKLTVTLQEELLPNTTYSIDFSDAIVDNNEGNPFGSYAFTFSTGEGIDTFQVAGHVLSAENLDPVKGIYVGAYRLGDGEKANADSTFYTTKLERISRTDAFGYFCIRGMAQGRYQIVALQDGDQNFRFNQKSEQIGYLDSAITTSSYPDTRFDTLWADTITVDTVLQVPYTHFTPDRLLLRAFKEDATMLYLRKTERLYPNRFQVYFSSPSPALPRITGLNFDAEDAFILEKSLHNDSLTYWFKDTLLCKMDTLRLAMEYLQTDTLGNLTPLTDTLALPVKRTVASGYQPKEENKKKRKWWQKNDKEEEEEEPQIQYLSMRLSPGSSMDILSNITMSFTEPVQGIDPACLHLFETAPEDSVAKPKPFVLRQDTLNIRNYYILAEWNPGYSYNLQVDSASIYGIYGLFNNKMELKTKMKTEDEYAALMFQISHIPDSAAYVELLSEQGKVQRRTPVERNRAEFYFVKPGKYYARLVSDRNGNGKWDTGLYPSLQPEQVFYFPKKLDLRALWDTEEDWDLTALPLDEQKPDPLKPQESRRSKQNGY